MEKSNAKEIRSNVKLYVENDRIQRYIYYRAVKNYLQSMYGYAAASEILKQYVEMTDRLQRRLAVSDDDYNKDEIVSYQYDLHTKKNNEDVIVVQAKSNWISRDITIDHINDTYISTTLSTVLRYVRVAYNDNDSRFSHCVALKYKQGGKKAMTEEERREKKRERAKEQLAIFDIEELEQLLEQRKAALKASADKITAIARAK